ncbi:unnamed protein product [Bursaphelenchus okinawaensis]|uniref:Very-long-chain 3-oxoacyl-CoA synthase n=1 Tax=Bursaphelenchus okinawaensis TaxID=465554 RepID=A0A811L1V9_9BILA|nr:unnamed protein product [Bursaphelenchus okinawaensis]CAG9115328.1 unnamed protein product [Bursaphelenchus okinawaensis]
MWHPTSFPTQQKGQFYLAKTYAYYESWRPYVWVWVAVYVVLMTKLVPRVRLTEKNGALSNLIMNLWNIFMASVYGMVVMFTGMDVWESIWKGPHYALCVAGDMYTDMFVGYVLSVFVFAKIIAPVTPLLVGLRGRKFDIIQKIYSPVASIVVLYSYFNAGVSLRHLAFYDSWYHFIHHAFYALAPHEKEIAKAKGIVFAFQFGFVIGHCLSLLASAIYMLLDYECDVWLRTFVTYYVINIVLLYMMGTEIIEFCKDIYIDLKKEE